MVTAQSRAQEAGGAEKAGLEAEEAGLEAEEAGLEAEAIVVDRAPHQIAVGAALKEEIVGS